MLLFKNVVVNCAICLTFHYFLSMQISFLLYSKNCEIAIYIVNSSNNW